MVRFVREHTLATILIVLFTVGGFMTDWRPTLMVVATVGVFFGFIGWIKRVDKDHEAKIAWMGQLEQDATIQDQQWIAGDERGLYGNHPPPQ